MNTLWRIITFFFQDTMNESCFTHKHVFKISFLTHFLNTYFETDSLLVNISNRILSGPPFPPPSPHIGEGNGSPLQYSCLENPMDGGDW